MTAIFYLALFLIVPTAAFVWFVISLVFLVRTPKADPKHRPRKGMAIASEIVAALSVGLAVLMAIVFIAIFLGSIGHM